MPTAVSRMLLVGDEFGLPLLVDAVPHAVICGIVVAGIRPKHHAQLEQLARDVRVPFRVQPVADSSEYPLFVEQVARLAPDLILVNSYSMLIRPELLRMARLGGINIHAALLPQYRGCNPIQWALINQEEETGVTMHVLAPEFDRGDIIAQERVPVRFEDTWVDVLNRLRGAIRVLLSREMEGILMQTHRRYPQDESVARYCRRRRPEDGEFRWEQPVISIYNLVRALVSPHPGAFFVSNGKKTVLDEYLTLPQIVEMKYSPSCGGQALKSGRVRMTPLSVAAAAAAITRVANSDDEASVLRDGGMDESRRNDVLGFSIHEEGRDGSAGILLLREIDYHQRGAAMAFVAAPSMGGDSLADVLRLSSTVAFDELHLERLFPRSVGNEKAFVEACGQAGLCPEGRVAPGRGAGTASPSIVRMRKAQEKPCQGRL